MPLYTAFDHFGFDPFLQTKEKMDELSFNLIVNACVENIRSSPPMTAKDMSVVVVEFLMDLEEIGDDINIEPFSDELTQEILNEVYTLISDE